MGSPGEVITTEISVAGANCPWCFNETIDSLRAEPGVVAVVGSITERCLRIAHSGVDTDLLVAVVKTNLHGEEIASTEHVMVAVDAHAADLHCTHGHDGTASADAAGCGHGGV